MLGDKPADCWAGGAAFRLMLWPAQTLGEKGLMLTSGLAFTLTVPVAVAVQLFVLVAVTVKLNPPELLLLHDTGLPTLLTKLPPLLAQA